MSATDPDGDPVTLSVTDLPAFGTFVDHGDGTATLTLAPPAEHPADDTVLTVHATDGAHSASAGVRVRVTPAAQPNRAPTLEVPDLVVVDAGRSITVAVTADDPDGDPLTLSARDLPAFVTFAPGAGGTATLTVAPPPDAPDQDVVVVVAADDGTTTTEREITLRVLERTGGADPVAAPSGPASSSTAPAATPRASTAPPGVAHPLPRTGTDPFAPLLAALLLAATGAALRRLAGLRRAGADRVRRPTSGSRGSACAAGPAYPGDRSGPVARRW